MESYQSKVNKLKFQQPKDQRLNHISNLSRFEEIYKVEFHKKYPEEYQLDILPIQSHKSLVFPFESIYFKVLNLYVKFFVYAYTLHLHIPV